MNIVSRKDAKAQSYKRFERIIQEWLVFSSFLRMPEPGASNTIDSGMYRNDEALKHQIFYSLFFYLGDFASLRETKKLSASNA